MALETATHVLILDAGTGIRALGETLVGDPREITLLCTHLHWDHLMGLPFFAPLYEQDRPINIFPMSVDGTVRSPLEVLDGVHFPRRPPDLPSKCTVLDSDGAAFLDAKGFGFSRIPLNHPGGGFGFRISHGMRSFVYLTDNELDAPTDPSIPFEHFVAFCAGADVLCHDAQYVAGEMQHRWGWGHSMMARVCELAIEARVGHLVLFHHDPDRDDTAVAAIEERARRALAPHRIECTAAFEGLEIDLA